MNKLSTKHFIFFIFSTILISLKSYSSIFIRSGGKDTWLISFLAILCIFILFIYFLCIYKDTNTFDINTVFLYKQPKSIGYLMMLFFGFGLFLVSIESASVFASSIHTNFFLETPTWYCLLFMVFPSAYLVIRRFNSILIVVLIISSILIVGDIILLLLISRYLDFSYILPVMKDTLTSNNLNCFFLLLGSISSIMISIPFLRYLSDSKKLIKHSTISIVICCFIIISSFISIISFFGPLRGGNIFYPEYVQSQRIQIASFIEFGELFYIFRSVCMWILKYVLATSGIMLLFDKFIKDKRIFIVIYSILIFIISFFITRNQYVLFELLSYLQYIQIFTFIIIPFISFSLYKIRSTK